MSGNIENITPCLQRAFGMTVMDGCFWDAALKVSEEMTFLTDSPNAGADL